MTNTEKLHQAYQIHIDDHHNPKGEKWYREVEANRLETANDLQVYGFMALEFGDIYEAIKALNRSVKKKGKDSQTLLLLGIAHRRLKEYAKAITAFRQALKYDAQNTDILYNLGITLDDFQSYEAAIDVLERGLEVAPKDTDLLNAIAGASASAAYTEDAIDYYRQAITIESNFAPFQYNLSQVLLQTEAWEEGWKLFDSRLAFRNQSLNPDTKAPFWKGENLEGKTILVWNEQGFGDTLQFVRYVPLLQQYGANVCLRVQPALKRLIQQNFEGINVISPKEAIPEVDFQIPIMSLPQFFGNTPLPLQRPIVSHQTHTPQQESPKLKIGLVWAGNPHHPDDQKRSIPARFFARLLKRKDVDWYSLQVGNAVEDLKDSQLTVLAPMIEDFVDTAQYIEELDLVISVDTAVAHLAASMNKKVWLLLDYAPDWRWGLDDSNTIWYPSVQIFRQEKSGDWNGLIKAILQTLKTM